MGEWGSGVGLRDDRRLGSLFPILYDVSRASNERLNRCPIIFDIIQSSQALLDTRSIMARSLDPSVH